MLRTIDKEKHVVAIIRHRATGEREAYVAHTVNPKDYWRRCWLAARAWENGHPYSLAEYPASSWMIDARRRGDGIHFVVVESDIWSVAAAQARKEAVMRAMLHEGVGLPVQVGDDMMTLKHVSEALTDAYRQFSEENRKSLYRGQDNAASREPLRIQEHMVLSELFIRVENELNFLENIVLDAYGAGFIYQKIKLHMDGLNNVKSMIEDRLFGESKNIDEIDGISLSRVYFGGCRNYVGRLLSVVGSLSDFRKNLCLLAGFSEHMSYDDEDGDPTRTVTLDTERLEKARALVSGTSMSVEDAAWRVGLASSTLRRYLDCSS